MVGELADGNPGQILRHLIVQLRAKRRRQRRAQLGKKARRSDEDEAVEPTADLVEGLRRDGLVAVDESSGEPRVSLP